jgi:hypothetical protein
LERSVTEKCLLVGGAKGRGKGHTIDAFKLIGIGPQSCAFGEGWLHIGGEEDVITTLNIIRTFSILFFHRNNPNSRFDTLFLK